MNVRPLLMAFALVPFAALAGADGGVSRPYTLANDVYVDQVCPDCPGGAIVFPANGRQPVLLVAEDAQLVAFTLIVCEDSDGDGTCLWNGEPTRWGCSRGMSLREFDAAKDLHVAAWNAHMLSPIHCGGTASAGTVAVHYA